MRCAAIPGEPAQRDVLRPVYAIVEVRHGASAAELPVKLTRVYVHRAAAEAELARRGFNGGSVYLCETVLVT